MNKQNKTDLYREHIDSSQSGGELGGLGKKGEGIEKYRLVVTK